MLIRLYDAVSLRVLSYYTQAKKLEMWCVMLGVGDIAKICHWKWLLFSIEMLKRMQSSMCKRMTAYCSWSHVSPYILFLYGKLLFIVCTGLFGTQSGANRKKTNSSVALVLHGDRGGDCAEIKTFFKDSPNHYSKGQFSDKYVAGRISSNLQKTARVIKILNAQRSMKWCSAFQKMVRLAIANTIFRDWHEGITKDITVISSSARCV